MVKNYTDLVVWQKSMDLVVEIYSLTKLLPEDERFGLVSQMRRSAVSIPSNIAEGHTRSSRRDFLRFLSIARGSKSELQTQLLICEKVNLLSRNDTLKALKLCSEISKMLTSLVSTLSNGITDP
ncbi:MAG: four helix bundle protein [Ruminococcaceae bacterium]|nr:four helix bundle protein [Oscillospiraceae bacterium]